MLTEPVVLLLLAAVIIVVIRLAWSAKAPRHGNKKAKNLARLRSSGQYWGVSIRNGNCSAHRVFTEHSPGRRKAFLNSVAARPAGRFCQPGS